jgi:predicted ribosome quality control (RQC) complex YloA/Tae2 family protein
MIQTYNDIDQEIQNFRKKFKDYAQIQKIFSSSHFISLQIRLPGKSLYLYFGRGHNYEGFWLGEKQIESALRKRDQFLEYMRRYLSASVLLDLAIDEKDRIIKIDYGRYGHTNSFFLFYCGRELYFANIFFDDKTRRFQTFCSWIKGNQETQSNSFSLFDTIGRKSILKNKTTIDKAPIEKLLKDEKAKALTLIASGKSRKFLVRKKKNIVADITQVDKWPKLFEFIKNGSDFSKLKRKENIEGFKISFKNSDHYKRQDELYLKVKKLKKAQKILSLRLRDTQDSLEKQNLNDFENKLKTIKPIWTQSFKAETIEIKKEKGYSIHYFDRYKIAVGLTAVGNDQMRKEWAKKDDLWFHAQGDKSPHIILKNSGTSSGASLDLDLFKVIGTAMLHYMKSSSADINLMYTQVKNLKGVKGVTGSVTFKKMKYINIIKEKEWDEIINNDPLDSL